MKISKNHIETFVGEVFPVYLIPEDDCDSAKINETEWVTWTCEGDVFIQNVTTRDSFGTDGGVIAVMKKAGNAVIRALLKGKEYVSFITARERKKYDGKQTLNYYRGDLHDHTSMIHLREPFTVREKDLCIDMLRKVKEDGKLDFTVISDHGDVLARKDFLRGFVDAELIEPINTVIFPGSESEASFYERDRFGTYHKHSGEVVMFNSTAFSAAYSWEEFVNDHRNSPLPIGIFAHPQVSGSSEVGLWNNEYKRNADSGLKRFMRLVEMGNGEDRAENLIHEYAYSDALDAGFKVSVSCSSDSHGPVWGSKACTGKTVIVSPEKSKEAFLDALNDCRAYATESGNVKLSYSVNGLKAPAELPLTENYAFSVDIGYFDELPGSKIVKCSVVSDSGERILNINTEGKDHLEFTVKSNTARYFYLRLVDEDGKKTWSMPVWCGREFDKYKENTLTPIDESEYKICDSEGNPLNTLKNRDLHDSVKLNKRTAEITVELNKERLVCALGINHLKIDASYIKARGESVPDYLAEFISKYRILTSCDGKTYKEVKSGIILVFGDEVILDFKPVNAKYLKFEVISTVGYESDFPKYMNSTIRLAEISVYN